jgi:hypothetical protein
MMATNKWRELYVMTDEQVLDCIGVLLSEFEATRDTLDHDQLISLAAGLGGRPGVANAALDRLGLSASNTALEVAASFLYGLWFSGPRADIPGQARRLILARGREARDWGSDFAYVAALRRARSFCQRPLRKTIDDSLAIVARQTYATGELLDLLRRPN